MNEIATIIPATTIKTDAKRLLIKAEQQVTIINGNNDATDEEKQRLESWLKSEN